MSVVGEEYMNMEPW